MKTSSAKAKGRLLQQLVAKKLRESFPQFTELDISSTSMGVSGEDVKLSQPAKNLLKIQVECKNRAKIAVYQDYAQAKTHGNVEPVVVLKQNHSKPLALVDLDYFIQLLRKATVNDNREEL
jgi:hypothetical protein